MIEPEDEPPINCSAWYALRLTPKKAGRINLQLDYSACGHRYWPKVSNDTVNWRYLPQEKVNVQSKGEFQSASLKIDLDSAPLFIAGQEILAPAAYAAWMDAKVESGDVERFQLGLSAEGRPIDGLRFGSGKNPVKEQVVLVGRQHPPEVTGAFAMLGFVDELAGDTDLARRYRGRFETTVVPLLNPDGVVRGFWRHNTGGTDLNRDWGPFKQPETRLMQKLLQDMDADRDRKLRLFLDFHSTRRDVFYTIPDSMPTDPPNYVVKWLERYQQRMGEDYKVVVQPSSNLTQGNSKNYVHNTYGIPAVTVELGDETDRELIRKIARESAIAMMETLLVTDAPAQ